MDSAAIGKRSKAENRRLIWLQMKQNQNPGILSSSVLGMVSAPTRIRLKYMVSVQVSPFAAVQQK